MRRRYMTLVLCLLVGMTSLTTGCSKLSKLATKPKAIAGAVITGVVSGFAYFGKAVGIKRNRQKKKDAAARAKGVSSFKLDK